MYLLEYEAKNLLKDYEIPVPKGSIFSAKEKDYSYPAVAKSQIPVGERGKHGGVQKIKNEAELIQTASKLLNTSIKGYKPTTILIEEEIDIKSEYYLSLLIDHSSASIRLMFNRSGGIEVESNAAASFLKLDIQLPLDKKNLQGQFKKYLGPTISTDMFADFVENLITCMIKTDALLIEINPLAVVGNGLVAVDCKMELDNNAAFRHPDWAFEEEPADANFVTLNPKGNIATIANGAGLAMATVDAVANMDMLPANFLDIGGGANEASVTKAFKAITAYENIQAIVINIFAGITRCDEVAKAIVGAKQHISNLPPLFIRLDGTNFGEAKVILDSANIELLPTLEDCLIKAKEVVS